jgi:hypothetical protein
MLQERYNADWVEENRAGRVLDSFKTIHSAVAELTNHMDEYRSGVARIHNRAIFEIPEILERILRVERPRQLSQPSQRWAAAIP